MTYVEIKPLGDSFRIRLVPEREDGEVVVSNAAFLGPMMGELGVRETGPWETLTDDDGDTFQRALVIG